MHVHSAMSRVYHKMLPESIQRLEAVASSNAYPSGAQFHALTTELSAQDPAASEYTIRTWFQNWRAKQKRQQR